MYFGRLQVHLSVIGKDGFVCTLVVCTRTQSMVYTLLLIGISGTSCG